MSTWGIPTSTAHSDWLINAIESKVTLRSWPSGIAMHEVNDSGVKISAGSRSGSSEISRRSSH